MIVFDDMIADMLSNKKLNPIVTELFIRGRYFSYAFLFYCTKKYQSKFYFIMNFPTQQEFQQITFNRLGDIDFQDFLNLCKKYIAKPYSFLVIDSAL